MNTWVAWIFDGDGWCGSEIEARTKADAETIAHERYQATRGFWTLKVEENQ